MKTIVIDIDGTILEEKPTFERGLAKFTTGAIDAINRLRNKGYRILLYTARSWAEYELTKAQLKAIPYDELIMGKPVYDYWIDDKAIAFTTWDDILNFMDMSEPANSLLAYLRLNISDFHKKIAEIAIPTILEIGPMQKETTPYHYLDTKELYESVFGEGDYNSVSLDGKASSTHFVMDYKDYPYSNLGTIVACSVIEHLSDIWNFPKWAFDHLREDGILAIESPFAFRFHGPRPDNWRITDDGYKTLFGEYFEILELNKLGDKINPLSMTVIMRKK